MPSEEDILGQQELLNAHRQTLVVLLEQQARHGESFTPPAIVNGILETRTHIQRLKAVLREWGVPVTDHPNDEEAAHPQRDSVPNSLRPTTTHITQTAETRQSRLARSLAMSPLTVISPLRHRS